MFTHDMAQQLAHQHRTPEQQAAAERIHQSFGTPGKMPHFKPITAKHARGDSRPVSADQFQQIALEGHYRLKAMQDGGSPPAGLRGKGWGQIKAETYQKVQQPWGGATIDAHTGQALDSKAN